MITQYSPSNALVIHISKNLLSDENIAQQRYQPTDKLDSWHLMRVSIPLTFYEGNYNAHIEPKCIQ